MNSFNSWCRAFGRGARGCRGLPAPRAPVRRSSSYPEDTTRMPMSKCLLVSKVTRLEYEKHRHKDVPPSELENILRKRGTDYDMLLSLHQMQKAFEMDVARSLVDLGLDVKVASRLSYSEELIKWCDIVLPLGGDGTFLLAASRVKDVNKPVVGFNSAPNRSVGRLCLPKWCSKDIRGAVQCLKEGRFRWMHRTRIRTTITCESGVENSIAPVDLHTPQLSRYAAVCQSYETADHVPPPEYLTAVDSPVLRANLAVKQLPFLALNEVFIGESVSARVSHLQLRVDDGPEAHTKSSGLCVTTGTGSTSWHLRKSNNTAPTLYKGRRHFHSKVKEDSINCLRTQSVQDLMRILAREFNVPMDLSLEKAKMVTEKYNNQLVFAPDSQQLAYSVRELIANEEWPSANMPRARDFARAVWIKSHCVDAGLVIDGGVSFPFNDGTEALLESLPEDCLRTVVLNDI